MTLAALITNEEDLNSLPAHTKSEYKKQADGTFVLDVAPVNGFSLEDVSGLKSAYSKTLETKKNLEKQIKDIETRYDGLDPSKAKDAILKLEELASGKLDDRQKAQIEAAVNQFKEKALKSEELLRKELDTHKTEAEKWKTSSISNAKKTAINEAIAKVQANPNIFYYLDSIIKPEVQDNGSIKLTVIDKDGNARLTNKSGSVENMTVEEHVNELKNNDTFAAFFPGTGASGSGANNSSGGRTKSGSIKLAAADSRDNRKYMAAKAEADKAGVPLEIIE